MNILTRLKKRENATICTERDHTRSLDEAYQDQIDNMTSCIEQDCTRTLDDDYLAPARRLGRLGYHIRCWCHQRPYWGAFCVLLASLLILWSPLCLIQNAIVPASTLWAGLTVGGLLFAMGLVALLAPSYALVAGAAGVVLSLLSLITALGGFGIGMFLGVIGSSCAVAWKPERKTISRPVFWSVFGCSLVILLGLTTLIAKGKLAIAAPITGPFTVFSGTVECHNTRSITSISQVDHRTPVVLAFSDFCIAHHVVITKPVFGGTIRITQGTSVQRGITSETVASHSDVSQVQKGALISTPGSLTELAGVDVETNIVAQQLFASVESVTNYDVTISFV